jgi:hypothetical protein
MQKQRERAERKTEEVEEQAPKTEAKDLSEIDALLDQIESVLEDNEDAKPDFDFKAKLKNWAKAQGNMRTNGDPCDDCFDNAVELAKDGYHPVPKWAAIEGAIEVPCGCC